MKTILRTSLCSIGVFALVFSFAGHANAAAVPTLSWGDDTASAQCDTSGAPVINVKREVIDSLDSGFGDSIWWARDDYRQQIEVWETDEDGVFCVTSRYQGQFNAIEGASSPDGEGTLSGDERGTFEGGYQGVIEGELKDEFEKSARGFIGSFDYNCDQQASLGGSAQCPGEVDWKDFYFDNASLSFDWWGWIYNGGKYGRWVNASSGSSGDIE